MSTITTSQATLQARVDELAGRYLLERARGIGAGPRITVEPDDGQLFPEDHHPARWTVVGQDAESVTVFAMCACGHDSCAWSTTVYADRFFPTGQPG